MKSAFATYAEISAPPPVVWARMTDWRNAPAWMAGIDGMSLRGDDPPGEGATLVFHARGKERDARIVGWEPPSRLALESRQGGVRAVYVYALTPTASGGTRVALDAACESRGLVWRLMSPLIRTMMKRVDGGQPEALKRLVEGND